MLKRIGPMIVSFAALMVLMIGCIGTTRSPARQLDDSGIHAAVKARLTGAQFSNVTNIDINVTNGVVTLAGEVPTQEIKMEAEREAKEVNGVVRVINNLQVKERREEQPPVSLAPRAAPDLAALPSG